jgi:hypothetical protein
MRRLPADHAKLRRKRGLGVTIAPSLLGAFGLGVVLAAGGADVEVATFLRFALAAASVPQPARLAGFSGAGLGFAVVLSTSSAVGRLALSAARGVAACLNCEASHGAEVHGFEGGEMVELVESDIGSPAGE